MLSYGCGGEARSAIRACLWKTDASEGHERTLRRSSSSLEFELCLQGRAVDVKIEPAGQVVVRRQLKRRQVIAFFQKLPPCLIGIEACAASHYWSRELQTLGHSVRLMPPA
jgi:hypothetical protein